MALIPKEYIDAVVSIGVKDANNKPIWIGTGFFVSRGINDTEALPFLVSNKHVLKGKKSVVIRMRDKQNNLLMLIDADLDGCVFHEEADIAVVMLNGSVISERHLRFSSFDIDNNAFSSFELRDNGVDEGSLVYMLGFPMGLVNVNSELPICRMGCIARISEEQINETKNVLLDIQNFPGNSGSPVVSKPECIAINGTKCLNRSLLVGIIHSYIPYCESLINSQTKEVVEVRSENSGLAMMHPVEYIRDVIDKFFKKLLNDESKI